MKRVFLVDYENVSEDGLRGFEGLDINDEVYLFYSANNGRISLNFVKSLYALKDQAQLHFMKAFTGKQALDIQLATFLGSLIEADKEGGSRFIIISKDKGFDHIKDFWNVYRPEVKLCRCESITNACSKNQEVKAQANGQEETAPIETVPEREAKPRNGRRKSASRQTKEVPNAEKTEKPQEIEQPAEEIQPQEVKEPQAAEKKPEEEVKPSLPAVKTGKTSLNAAVMQTLSKEKYDYKIVGQAASLAVSFCGQRYQKRETYKAMVKQFGQKEGLAIYNLIKGLL